LKAKQQPCRKKNGGGLELKVRRFLLACNSAWNHTANMKKIDKVVF